MAEVTKETLKTYFETGDTPTESNFEDLIDSTYKNISDANVTQLTNGGETSLHKHAGSGINIDNSSFIVLSGTQAQALFEQTDSALTNARTTGVRTGGDLTINAGDSNKFDVSELVGQILDNSDPENPVFYDVTFTSKTAVSPENVGFNYLYYNLDTDTLIQSTSAPTYQNRKSRIYIGRVIFRDGVIQGFAQDKDYIQQIGLQLRSVAQAIGQIQVSGLRISANGANLLINMTDGVMFDFGVNGFSDPHNISLTAKTGATFQYLSRATSITVNRTTIDPDNYDVGDVVTAVGNNKFTIQDIWIFSSGNIRIQYGQNEYNTIDEARAAIPTRVYTENPALSNGLRIAYLIIKKGTVSLQNASNVLLIPANKFGLL